MHHGIKSIRPFIGAQNFETSRNFYRDFGFEEVILSNNMSLFRSGNFGFYLQDAYVQNWIENSMVFLEVENLEDNLTKVKALQLENKYPQVRISNIHHNVWGNEYFVHDPSGVLWHIGEFNS